MGYLILAGLLENRTAKSTKAFNPKKEANLLLSFAVSTKRKMRIDAQTSEGQKPFFLVLLAFFLVLSVVVLIGSRKTTERQQKGNRKPALTIPSVLTRKQKEKRKVLDPPAKYSVRLVQDFDITSSQASLSLLIISWPF